MVDFITREKASLVSNKQDKLELAAGRYLRKQNIVIGTWTIKQVGHRIHMEAKAPTDECFKVLCLLFIQREPQMLLAWQLSCGYCGTVAAPPQSSYLLVRVALRFVAQMGFNCCKARDNYLHWTCD